jgi:uncharacterized protein YwqG
MHPVEMVSARSAVAQCYNVDNNFVRIAFMLTREKLLALLEQYGLSHRADEILSHCKPSIHLSLQYGVDEADIPIGASKMGGSPDVPPDFVWPEWNGIPLTFIAQFRLPDVKPFDVENLLPEKGMLYFFFEQYSFMDTDYESQTFGSQYKVIYAEDEWSVLKRIKHPLARYKNWKLKPYTSCTVAFEHELIPHPIETAIPWPPEATDSDQAKQQMSFADTVDENLAKPMHRLLGYDTNIQGYWGTRESLLEQWKSNDIDEWLLLLQVDSDYSHHFLRSRILFNWGDSGCIYFWIRKDDLKSHNFNDVWMDWETH